MELTREETMILSYLCTCEHYTCSEVEVLNHFIGTIDVNKGKKFLYALKEKHLISISRSSMVTCSSRGFAALSKAKESQTNNRFQLSLNVLTIATSAASLIFSVISLFL